jgi:RNA polymerase sigma factor (sigma-70 family)
MSVHLPPFQTFFETHRDDVYRFLVATLGRIDADDVFQETFLAALRAYPALRSDENLRSWIFTIAHRKAIDEFRASTRRASPVSDVPEVARPEPTQAEPELWEQVRGLPPKQRAAVVHRYVHDLPYDEIAALLDCSPEAARRSTHEAVRKLRTTWQR